MKSKISSNNDNFAVRVKQIRKSLKLTQADLAAGLGITGAALSDIEKSKSRPGHDFFYNISREYHVNLYYLLFGEGEMFVVPETEDSSGSEEFTVNEEDFKKFMWYFKRSRIIQYLILGQFHAILRTNNKESIEKEVGEYNPRPKT